MDDLTINIGFPNDITTLDDIAQVATALYAKAHDHRFALNTQPGKTEATINHATPNALAALGNMLLIPPPPPTTPAPPNHPALHEPL